MSMIGWFGRKILQSGSKIRLEWWYSETEWNEDIYISGIYFITHSERVERRVETVKPVKLVDGMKSVKRTRELTNAGKTRWREEGLMILTTFATYKPLVIMMHIQQEMRTTMPTSHIYNFSSVEHIQIPTENRIKSFYGQVNCLSLECSHLYLFVL